jgi:ADP-ribosylglycohydrolase
MVDAMPEHGNRALSPEALKSLDTALENEPGSTAHPIVPFDRFEAMMLRLAIGDSLGNSTESQLPGERHARHGEIAGYLPHPKLGDARGYPSDDTQMAFWTLEHLIEHGRLMPMELARTFATRRISGIGHSVKEFVRRYKGGFDWAECGVPSAGNGALMRIAPLVYEAVMGRSHRLAADTILATAITHNDSMAIASSVAAVNVLVQCCQMARPPGPEWWATEFIAVLKAHETSCNYRSQSPAYPEFRGPLWQFLERYLLQPARMSMPLPEALDWYSGAFLLETVPTCLLILMRYAGDPEQAMLRAVNDTKDNDTIAAIAGAFLGALHGKEFLPRPWIEGLAGRTREDDDGAVFRILARAKQKRLDQAVGGSAG